MPDEATEVAYRLSQTRVVVTGATETEAHEDGRLIVAANAAVQLRSAADPHEWLTLRLPERAAADRAFTLSLTEDGRLLSTDATATGRAGGALKAAVSTVATVAGVALGAFSKVGLTMAALGDQQSWESQHEELGNLRTSLREAQTSVRSGLAAAYKASAEADDPRKLRQLMGRAADLRRLLAEVARDLAEVEAHRAEWLRQRVDRRSETHAFVFDVDDLPSERFVATWPNDPEELTDEKYGRIVRALHALGVVVTCRDVTPRSQQQSPNVDGTAYEGVWYRRTRQVELRVYRVVGVQRLEPAPDTSSASFSATHGAQDPVAVGDELERTERPPGGRTTSAPDDAVYVPIKRGNGPVPWLELVEQREVEVVDKHCASGYVPFRTAWFGTRTSAISFGPLGAPVSIGSSAGSALAEVAETVGALPQQVLAGLAAANKIVDETETATRQAADRRLADLQRRQAVLEQELQTTELAANADLRTELSRVKAEQDLLTGRRDFESVTRELELQRRSTPTWQTTQLDEMANALTREKVERLELDVKLRQIEADVAAQPLEHDTRLAELEKEIERLRLETEKIKAGELPERPTDTPTRESTSS